jgi:hypothetical protein
MLGTEVAEHGTPTAPALVVWREVLAAQLGGKLAANARHEAEVHERVERVLHTASADAVLATSARCQFVDGDAALAVVADAAVQQVRPQRER